MIAFPPYLKRQEERRKYLASDSFAIMLGSTTAPTVTGVVVDTDGETIYVVFDRDIAGTLGFTVSDGIRTNITLTNAVPTGITLTATLSAEIFDGQILTISYDSVTGDMVDASDPTNELESFTGMSVDNQSLDIPASPQTGSASARSANFAFAIMTKTM